MKYSYKLRFSTGAYAELLPSNQITLEGGWQEGTMIWREKIGEVKISRLKNATIYDTLESWFSDDTKFETRINIQILKDGVEESVHWFGVKWGTINEHTRTYTVTPILYDFWGQYFESLVDVKQAPTRNRSYSYYNTIGTYPFVSVKHGMPSIKDYIEDITLNIMGWANVNVVSSFLWQDNYEDTSAVGTYRGMPKDYVTGIHSFLTNMGIIGMTGVKHSFSDVLEWLKLFRTFVFFDSNDKLRFEHVKFFNDKLVDNAVDYSAYMKDTDEEYSYDNSSIITHESIQMKADEEYDEDFGETEVIYSNIRNRPDTESFDYISGLYSNIASYGASLITDDEVLFSALENHIYKWFNIDFNSFNENFNAFFNSASTGQTCGSSDFSVANSEDYDFVIDLSVITTDFNFYIKDRSSSVTISNTLTISGSGSGTLTTTGDADDAYLVMEAMGNGSITGWVTLIRATFPDLKLITPVINGKYSAAAKRNGAFSMANIFDKWWQDDRVAMAATVDGGGVTFDGTQYNLRRNTININLTTIPNPLYGFNDGTRIAKIDKWVRNPKTGFYKIDLIYQEDD